MKKSLLPLLVFIVTTACQPEASRQTPSQHDTPFSLQANSLADWTYENLALLPILAEDAFVRKNTAAGNWNALSQALQTRGFRITEVRSFGRLMDPNAGMQLTVQNKTPDTVLLLEGQVVRGGRQDRIIAETRFVPPRSITNINVFCVEQNRWSYPETKEALSPEEKQQVYAFSRYYHFAANEVREVIQKAPDQEIVWQKVASITAAHNAETPTGTYAGLENSEAFTRKRDAYLAYFKERFQGEHLVGLVALSGKEIIGVDVFAHPSLFHQHKEGLLNGYITEALTEGTLVEASTALIEGLDRDLAQQFFNRPNFSLAGRPIHYANF